MLSSYVVWNLLTGAMAYLFLQSGRNIFRQLLNQVLGLSLEGSVLGLDCISASSWNDF